MEAVVEKGKHYEVEIIDMGEAGEGIGKVQDFTLFVEGGLLGDIAEVCVYQVKKNYGFAKVIQCLKPSPWRREAACSLHKACGGCQFQDMQYEMQLSWKQKRVENCLKRIGKLEDIPMQPIIGMTQKERYRNKAQYPIRQIGNEVVIGFFTQRSHEVVSVSDCMLQPKSYEEILERVKAFLEDYGISIFNESTRKGLVRHLMIKSGNQGSQIMICLVINGKSLPHHAAFIETLTQVPNVKSIVLSHSYEKRQETLGECCTTLYGQDYIMDHIGPLHFKISPLAFFQVNPEQTEKLYEQVLAYAELTGNEVVWDAYCGIGSISLFLAQKAQKVYGVEIVPDAIEDAKENAQINGLTNTTFYAGKAEEVIPKMYEEGIVADVIVVDPPRKGCDEALLKTIKQMSPEKVVYVSCNPSTLARDLFYLTTEAGYHLEAVQPVDMFGNTTHVETVVKLSK